MCVPIVSWCVRSKVIDDTTGKPISGASVYGILKMILSKIATNSEGTVYVVGKIGNCSVAAYAEEFCQKKLVHS